MVSNVNIKYLHAKAVNDKRQTSLVTHRDFLMKQNHLKSCGKKMKLLNKVSDWLKENSEAILSQRSKSLTTKQQSAVLDTLWKEAETMVRKNSVNSRKQTIKEVQKAT